MPQEILIDKGGGLDNSSALAEVQFKRRAILLHKSSPINNAGDWVLDASVLNVQ